MRVYREAEPSAQFKNAALTIGTFDGVHKGHKKLIERIRHLATAINGESLIITFHPHPRLVIKPEDTSLRLLNTTEEKIALLEKCGVDNLVIVPFSRDFSEQSAENYISHFLVRNFHPKFIVIGYDHRFGKDRQGDYHLLEKMKTRFGYEMEEISKEMLDDIAISSTKIREALSKGEINFANHLLGYNYMLSGTVIRGLQNGRKLGFPTANMQVSDPYKLIPSRGIYAVWVRCRNKTHQGMLSIGFNPTFEGKEQTVEVNILDFDEDIYGDNLTIEFVEFIRAEKKFDSTEDLVAEMLNDEIATRKILKV